MHTPRANGVLLSSIPINRKVKRYWVSKFERIAANCGNEEAVRKFKNLRVQVLAYLADSDRHSNLDKYLSSTGFRTNGMLRKLFEQADCQPHFILSFLKLYSAPKPSFHTKEEAAEAEYERLAKVRSNEAIPQYLSAWLDFVLSNHPSWIYGLARRNPRHLFHRAAMCHSYDEWRRYWKKWYSVLRRGWTSDAPEDDKLVFPEIYKDYTDDANHQQSSRSYDRDFSELVAMHFATGPLCPLSEEELEFVDSFLDEDVRQELLSGAGTICTDMPALEIDGSLLGFAVGEGQHIPKKGSGGDDRDIAVPNRFIQRALAPGAARLYNLVRCLPKDATFDQSRFDTLIQCRVNNSNLYQGSVDLSKATDNLPLLWGREVVDTLWVHFRVCDRITQNPDHCPEARLLLEMWQKDYLRFETPEEEKERRSIGLFYTVARAPWADGKLFQRWKVGQPLGSLPSFAMLAITHNLLVESMACSLGLLHSPYFILGDDIVITNKKLRKRYIRELTSRSIPLSLHKSFEGRLSEFAGKTYVAGCIPFYTSDHSAVTWNSLLDWQRTTGIRIPWESLPKACRSKILSLSRKGLEGQTTHPTKSRVIELARSAYDLTLTCEVCGRGSHLYPIRDSEDVTKRIAGYFEYRSTDSPVPEAVNHSGITLLGNRYPVTLMDRRFANKNGYFQRFRPVQLPDWYKAKVRPCTTDAAISAAVQAILANEPLANEPGELVGQTSTP
jgi:hypothetical protein